MDDYVPRRYLSRRKLVSASAAEQRYRKAVLEAGAELAHEFSEHYWKEVLQKEETDDVADRTVASASTSESIMKGFLFYLNASGRYLVLREHLRSAISTLVQQKCLNMRPSGFHNHRDLQAYLHDMYIYLVEEMHEVLNASTLQETDPLRTSLDRLLQQTNCEKDQDLTKVNLHQRHISDLGIFAEEAFAQGDFESCHKLHLQRTCKDKESSRCWTEFAVMWLSKGNDRMAEIAVREALLKDPLNIFALIISGIISIRHGDVRGLDCLKAALGLKPLSPELLVIFGVANSMVGNEEAADIAFRKAAYVHRVITGKNPKNLEKMFTEKNEKRAFNMKEYISQMESSPSTAMSELAGDPAAMQQEEDPSLPPILDDESEPSTKRRTTRRSKQGSIAKAEETELAENAAVKKKRRSSGKNSTTMEGDVALPRKDSNNSTTKKRRSSGKNSSTSLNQEEAPPSPPPPSKFNFAETIGYNIQLAEAELPPLLPSIQSPWDVTEFNEKIEYHLQALAYLEGGRDSGSGSMKNSRGSSGPHNQIPEDDGVAPDSQLKEEYDQLSGRKGKRGSRVSKNSLSTGDRSSKDSGRRLSKKSSGNNNSDKGQGDAARTSEDKEAVVIPAPFPAEPIKSTDRLGSELIWAANLLVNLRLFDFMDGVLAKQLYFYENRTIQFLYLRALSLYLRQREAEALRLIKEAIEMNTANGKFLALEGHCYYTQSNFEEAMISYEKALKLPHANENRHLLYIRYGSLVLDSGKTKLGKRVFLHGVSKYPTPYMWLALGNVCFQRGEYDQAESAFSEANRLDNTNPISWGHLALTSLLQDKKELAEQSYKWALRFGLKKGPLLDEIQRLQKEKGFGDPSFPRLPNCLPHDYFLRRMGKVKPFNIYKEGLNQNKPRMGRDRFADTENELSLKKKPEGDYLEDEWEGEGEEEDEYDEDGHYFASSNPPVAHSNLSRTTSAGKSVRTSRVENDAVPPLITIKDPPPPPPSAAASQK